MRSYNIIFNSRNGTQPSSNKADSTYTFDFNNIPDGEYRASFSYMGEQNDLSISNAHNYKIACVYIDTGKANDYQAGNSSGTIKYSTTNFLGTLDISENKDYAFLYSKHQDNTPVFFNRPSNNVVNIKVLSNSNGLYLDSGGNVLNHYVLVLHLELVKEYVHRIPTQMLHKEHEEYEEVEVEEEESFEIPSIFNIS